MKWKTFKESVGLATSRSFKRTRRAFGFACQGQLAWQKLLGLQEALTRLARRVATCLAVESQWPQLVAMLREEVSEVLTVALRGFQLQGIFFRLVINEEDWKAIRMELRLARRRGLLLVALEGLGVRLLASPLVPWEQPWP